MRVLCPAQGETIVIDGHVSVTVLEVNGDEVVLAVDAPDWLDVREQELLKGPADPGSVLPH